VTKKVYAPGLILLLSAVCLTSTASAQTSWWRTYGGAFEAGGYSVQQTSDGGYVVVGHTDPRGTGDYDMFLVKTDSAGDTLWTKAYRLSYYNEAHCIRQTVDGGYIITGYAGNGDTGDYDLYLIRTDAHGDTLWTRCYGGPNFDMGSCVRQTTDSGYIVTGHTGSFGDGQDDVWLVRTDKNGDSLWTKTFGGGAGWTVYQLADGGFIVAGSSGGIYLIRTTANGDTQWTRKYAGTDFEVGTELQLTADGGYIVTGYADSLDARGTDVRLIKTDSQGDTLWTRTYGGTRDDRGNSVQQTSDGGYMIAGATFSFGAGFADVYVVKTNASGDTLWTRTFGGTSYDWGYAVQQTTDGGYIIAGMTKSYGAGAPDHYNVYLIKTDANGNAIAEGPLAWHPTSPNRLAVRPNPFTSFARVPGHEADVFALSDITGRHVAICKGGRIGAGLRPGVYFLSPASLKTGKAVTIIKAAY